MRITDEELETWIDYHKDCHPSHSAVRLSLDLQDARKAIRAALKCDFLNYISYGDLPVTFEADLDNLRKCVER